LPAPSLTDLSALMTFAENTVNVAPQLLDIDVTFTDPDDNFDGGTLTLSGLLAEDTVSVRNQGTGAGEIGFDGTNVSYGGVVIGTLVGGVGTALTITFNAAATSVAIDALIQNLTYANSSDAPITSRDLLLNVTDAAGDDLGRVPGDASFAVLLSGANPFYNIDIGLYSRPSFIDLDGDGDLDLVIGAYDGTLYTYRNGDASTSGAFTALTGATNPFDGIDVGTFSTPSFVDLDGDGDLDLVIGAYDGTLYTYRNGDASTSGAFTALTGATNPFDGIDVGFYNRPSFVDIDGDGDLDLVVGERYGTIATYRNGDASTSGTFTQLIGVANPFNGIDVGDYSTPSFVDIDGDGDLDLVIGVLEGTLATYRNGDSSTSGAFTQLIGADNPFDGIDVGSFNAPSFVDIDGDGDLDLVMGGRRGTLETYENTTPAGLIFTIAITPENDTPILTNLPGAATVFEDTSSNLDLSALTLSDPDVTDVLTVVLAASAGTMVADNITGVTTTGSGTSTLTLVGTATAIDAYLNSANAVRYTGAQDVFGYNAATLTLTGDDGSGVFQFGTVNINITNVNETHVLTGLDPVTFAENTVNAAPQLLDTDVVFTDPDNNFEAGTLTLTGLLPEDTVSVRNQGTGAGEIGFNGTSVTYGGVVIGTLVGGVGAALTIAFNAVATTVAIDALIQNLTYANNSNTPTTSRNLFLNVTDAPGEDFGRAVSDTSFAMMTGTANPFNGIDVGSRSKPSFVDIDGDGDLDLVVGESFGTLKTYRNGDSSTAGAFTQLIGAANPFNGIDVGYDSAPYFVDIDGDGDLDLVVGKSNGTLNTYRNGTTSTSGAFTQLIGAANPFNGIDVGHDSAPSFVDLDGDNDLDLVTGAHSGTLATYRNGDAGTSGAFTYLSGASNPFNGIDVGSRSAPSFVDIDGDGDLDLVVGENNGILNTYRNG